METLHCDLERQTSKWAAAEDGLRLLRQELLDSVDRELVHDALSDLKAESRALVRRRIGGLPETETEMRRHREANALRRSVLRCWAANFYDDSRTGDWFDTYERAAALRRTTVARDLRRLAGERFDAAQNHRDAAVHALNTSLRLRLLKLPPHSIIGRSDSQRWLRRLLRRFYHEKANSQRPSLS